MCSLCQYFQTKALPHTWVSSGLSMSLPPSTPAGANHSQHLPGSRNLFPYIFLIQLHLSMYANFSTCSPPCSHWLTPPHVAVYTALVFGNRHLLTSFHYSGRQSDTLPTTCLRILCWGLFSFSSVINFLPCPTECQALVARHCWCDAHQLTWERFSFKFHYGTGPWKALKDLACFCKLLILLKDSKISKTSTHLHSWKPVLKGEPGTGPQIACRTIFWWEQIQARLWEQIWFTGKFCCHADSKYHLWSPRTGERAQPSCQRAMQLQITMQEHLALLAFAPPGKWQNKPQDPTDCKVSFLFLSSLFLQSLGKG